MTGELVLTGFFLLLSVQDIRHQRISLKALAVMAAAGVVLCVLPDNLPGITGIRAVRMDDPVMPLPDAGSGWLAWCVRFLPGAVLTAAAAVSKRQIGIGDGLVFMICGLYETAADTIRLLCISFLVSAGVAAVFLLRKTKGRKEAFAFLPCALIAQILHILCEWKVIG